MTSASTVAVLDTGLMGSGMARSLLRAGCQVRVWNRTADKAEPLAADGAQVAADPAIAVAGANVVLTMLFDAESVETVMADVLPAMAPDAIWLQAATIGLSATEGVAELAEGQRCRLRRRAGARHPPAGRAGPAPGARRRPATAARAAGRGA